MSSYSRSYLFFFRNSCSWARVANRLALSIPVDMGNVAIIDARTIEHLFLANRLAPGQSIYARYLLDAFGSLKIHVKNILASLWTTQHVDVPTVSYPAWRFYLCLGLLLIKKRKRYFTYQGWLDLGTRSGLKVYDLLHHDISLFLKLHRIDEEAFSRNRDELYLYSLQLLAVENSFLGFSKTCCLEDAALFSQEGYSINQLIKSLVPSSCSFIFYTHPSHRNFTVDYADFSFTTLPTRRRLKCEYWDKYLFNKMPPEPMLWHSIQDLKTRLFTGGSHVYSPSLEEKSLQCDGLTGLPLVTLFTSSLDEFEATRSLQAIFDQYLPDEPQIFSSQASAITFLAWLANASKSFRLIIRHHPRLGAVKSEPASQYIYDLLNAADNSEYVQIVRPEDRMSSYSLILRSNLVLNCWSNIGLESLRLGKRCINLFSNHHSVCYWPQTLFPRIKSIRELETLILDSLSLEYSDRSEDISRSLLAHSFYLYFSLITCKYIGPGDDPLSPECWPMASSAKVENAQLSSRNQLEILAGEKCIWKELNEESITAYQLRLGDLIIQDLGRSVYDMSVFGIKGMQGSIR